MGLPIFREPDEEADNKVAAKLDKAAASSRSAIRREPAARPSHYERITSPRSRGSLRVLDALTGEPMSLLDPRRPRRRTYRTRITWDPSAERTRADLDRAQAGEALLRDVLQHERPGQRLRLTRPARESALRYEVAPSPPVSDTEARPASAGQHALTRSYIPSPPYSLSGNRFQRPAPAPAPAPAETRPNAVSGANLTPSFAPARAALREAGWASGDISDLVDRLIPNAALVEGATSGAATPTSDSWASPYPPLLRVPHLSPRPVSGHYDGLGDRQRSPPAMIRSPSDSVSDEDTWETLLTTMEEDEHPPSADSSFTSAIASASTSRGSGSASRSTRSSQTTMDGMPEEQIREHEAYDNNQPRYRFNHGSAITIDLPPCESDCSDSSDDEVNNEPSRLPARTGSADRPGPARRPFLRADGMLTLAPIDLPRSDRITAAEDHLRRLESRAAETEAELAHMQRFVDRLVRRQDIPDERWAAAGLSRTIRETNA